MCAQNCAKLTYNMLVSVYIIIPVSDNKYII